MARHPVLAPALGLVVLLSVSFASAQEQPAAPAADPAGATEEVTITDEAKQHFRTGVAYLTDPDGAQYGEAYREFKAAYEASPSWKILGNLGISAMKLERDGEAIVAFEKYLTDGGAEIESSERAQMERDLQVTQASVVYVTLQSTPPGAHFVDERVPLSGRNIVNRYDGSSEPVRLGLHRGHHRIRAQLAGYEEAVWEFDAEPGQEVSHTFEMKLVDAGSPMAGVPPATQPDAAPQTERPVPVSVWVAGGVTGGLLVGGIVTGVLAKGKNKDFEEKNNGTDPSGAQSLKDSGETLNLVADICFLGAVAGAATTVALYFLRPEVPVKRDATALRVSPSFGPTGGGLSLTGAF